MDIRYSLRTYCLKFIASKILAVFLFLILAFPATAQNLDVEMRKIAEEVAEIILGTPRRSDNKVQIYMLPPVDTITKQPCAALSTTLSQRMRAMLKQSLGANRYIVRITVQQAAEAGEIAMRLSWTVRHGKLEVYPEYGRMDKAGIENEVFSHARISLDSLSINEQACLGAISNDEVGATDQSPQDVVDAMPLEYCPQGIYLYIGGGGYNHIFCDGLTNGNCSMSTYYDGFIVLSAKEERWMKCK